MSVFLNRFPLQRLPLRKQFSRSCPFQHDMFSPTLKVNMFLYMCTFFLVGRVTKLYLLQTEDIAAILKKIDKLEKQSNYK